MTDIIAKLKLVRIIAPFESDERVTRTLRRLGVRGYTSMRVTGHGEHGPRKFDVADGANVLMETVVTESLAKKILIHLDSEFRDIALTAYAIDAEAIPHAHFA